MGREHRERIAAVQGEMKKQGIDILLVFTADEHGSEYIDDHYKLREYLSGFTGSAGSLLIEKEKAVLWTDGRYFIQAERELEGSCILLYRTGMPGVPTLKEYIKKMADDACRNSRSLTIGADLKLVTVRQYMFLESLRDKGLHIRDTDPAAGLWRERPDRTQNPVYALPDEVTGRSAADKLSDIRRYLYDQKADSVIISDLSDVMWLFNIRGSDIMYSPVAVSYGYVDRESAVLFVTGSSTDGKLKGILKESGVEIREYDTLDDQLSWLKGMKIICDYSTLNAHVYGLIKDNELIDRPSFQYIKKHLKNEAERLSAKKWHTEDGLVLTRFIYRIKRLVSEGERTGKRISEYDAAMMLDDMRRETDGNRGLSFETISAYGSNAAIVHYAPSSEGSTSLKPEGFLLVDSGGQYDGATTDVTRTIALGKLTDEMKQDYTAVLKGVLDLSDAVFLEGTRGENLDILARRPLWERYSDYRHGTGHGVGAMLNVHEGPQAFRYKIDPEKPQPVMEEGMITSDEPGIYFEGKYGIRIENLLLCTLKKKNEWGKFMGFDTLTLVPYEREAIVPGMLTEHQKELINEYHRTIYYLYLPRMNREEKEWLADVTAKI